MYNQLKFTIPPPPPPSHQPTSHTHLPYLECTHLTYTRHTHKPHTTYMHRLSTPHTHTYLPRTHHTHLSHTPHAIPHTHTYLPHTQCTHTYHTHAKFGLHKAEENTQKKHCHWAVSSVKHASHWKKTGSVFHGHYKTTITTGQ